jgi:hypothetical protein
MHSPDGRAGNNLDWLDPEVAKGPIGDRIEQSGSCVFDAGRPNRPGGSPLPAMHMANVR